MMSLPLGTRVGPYEIEAPIGAGGMGEVYRARDTRLGRDVAIKILPENFASDPKFRERFKREARAISSLQHPNICTLYDIGRQGEMDYLVLEYLEGETLDARLRKGPLPTDQVLKCGAQIAEALDKAHRQGLTHRDLKPGNVMLTKSGVKLLDFGLAKPIKMPVAAAALDAMTHTSTTSLEQAPITSEGTLIGTFQYMSPEQLEGKEADARSDIFSMGCVLYEMATGKRPFDGKTIASAVAAILASEPKPITALLPASPPALDRLVKQCLAKDPDERWQSAHDLKSELDWILQVSAEAAIPLSPAARKLLRARPIVLGIAAALFVGAAATTIYFRRETPVIPTIRAIISTPPNVTLLTLGDHAGPPVISRDGLNLVFVGLSGGRPMLFLRALSDARAQPLKGTENGKSPFWSEDGKSIGFFADGNLKRLDLAGGPPTTLARAADGRGGTWAGDVILFTPDVYDVIYRVSASGGKPSPVTKLDRSQHTTHRWPFFLPDGKHFLYLAANHASGKEGNSAIYVGSIAGDESKLILRANGSVNFTSGQLLYFRDGNLMAQAFDADRLKLAGDATPLGEVLRDGGNWAVMATASENGVLIYQSAGELKYPVIWFDRSGRSLGPAPLSGQLEALRLSPDGDSVAASVGEGPTFQAYVYDLKTGSRTRLTFGENALSLVWSPDGTQVVYSCEEVSTEKIDLCLKRADGSGAREVLLSSGFPDEPTDWTYDKRYIVFDRGQRGSRRIWILPLSGDRKPFPLFSNADYDHNGGHVSPNGKWIAYTSRESGASEIYVTSFPDGIGKWQIGSGSASRLRWRADGREIYFATQDGNVMVVSVEDSAGSFRAGLIRPLFPSPFATGRLGVVFDVVAKDGQRFIGGVAPDSSSLPLNVVTNWTVELKKK